MSGNVSVLTYENPYTFHQKPEFQPYANSPHICATKSLEKGIGKRIKLSSVQSIRKMIELFYPKWNLPETRFTQYTQLSDLLRNWDVSREPKVIRSFKRNKLNLLITMRNLTEIGLRPSVLKPKVTKVEEEIFCDLWEGMLPHFQGYMEDAAEKVKDLETVKKVFTEANIPLVDTKVVLHGFYYISPVQHHLFTKWKELGLDIVFLNLYHRDFPSVFSFLNENFSEKYGWAQEKDWQITKDEAVLNGIRFASRFEGTESGMGNAVDITEKPYEYMVDFVEDIKENVCYVSPNREELKERIREFRPDSFLKERHFLAYPIGQYLFHLHSVWDEENKDYILTERILMESFASGWLEVEGENAREYTTHLKAVMPYFTNCHTAEEWMARFQTLMDAKRSSIRAFRKYSLKKNDFLEAVRVIPVLRFSYFSVHYRVLEKLQKFIWKLVRDATWLLDIQEERVSIKTHFQRIQQLLDDSNIKSSLANEVEKKLVDQLEDMLTKPVGNGELYHISDLSDAIMVFLKNGLEDPDQDMVGSLDQNPDSVDAENKPNVFRLYKMADLDGLILRGDVEVLHVCGLDEQHFPETSSPMPWPLSLELIEKLDNPSTDMYLFRKEHSLDFSRYLFFVALCFEKKISLSWVKNWNEYHGLDKSIYMEILGLDSVAGENEGDYGYIEPIASSKEYDRALIQEKLAQLPQEEFAEMSLCRKRFVYSSIVSGFASYHSPFHQGFLIGNLVKVYASTGKTKSEILDMLGEMFPFLTRITLRTIVDQNMNEDYVAGMRKYGLGKRRKFNGIEYPESMLYFQFLTHRGAFQNELWQSAFVPQSGVRSQKAELIQQFLTQSGVLPKANPSVFCKLCPHAEYCEDAYYAVDISKKGFDDNDHDAAGF